MNIEKAKNRCNELVKVEHANWIGISNQEAIEVLLNELEKYEKQLDLDYVENELDKKEKIINEMAIDLEYINKEILDEYDKLPYAESKQKVIDYFTKKVTKED